MTPRHEEELVALSDEQLTRIVGENQEKIDTLLKLTERYCVVFQTINTKPQLDVVVNRTNA